MCYVCYIRYTRYTYTVYGGYVRDGSHGMSQVPRAHEVVELVEERAILGARSRRPLIPRPALVALLVAVAVPNILAPPVANRLAHTLAPSTAPPSPRTGTCLRTPLPLLLLPRAAPASRRRLAVALLSRHLLLPRFPHRFRVGYEPRAIDDDTALDRKAVRLVGYFLQNNLKTTTNLNNA